MNEPVVIGHRAMVELARRSAMLDAVAYGGGRILAARNWRSCIVDLLERLAAATEMSRVTLFEAHPGPDGMLVQSCRYDWAAAGLAPLSDDPRYQDMDLSDDDRPGELGEWSRLRQQGRVVQATLREVTGYTRQVFLEHGTLSFLSVPVMADGGWWGFLGFDDCRQERVWSQADIDVLRTAAALIAGAIERERATERLRVSEERYALAARGANDGLWDWDLIAGTAYFSPRLHEILGLPDGALGDSVQAFLDRLDPDDAATLTAAQAAFFASGQEKFELVCRLRCPPGQRRWVVLRGLVVYLGSRPRRIVGAARDITERKLAEERAAEAERKRASLARYFSPNMVDELMQSGRRLDQGRTQTVVVLFADVMGFTRISARLPAGELFGLLREYLGLVEEAVFAHGGTLDKFLGDGLMATFGTPHSGPDDATRAVRCAAAMAARVVAWNDQRKAMGKEPLQIGIGLHRGEVVLGDIGSERRMEFAVIGDTVNIASRIQEMTRTLDIGILASDQVVAQVRAEGGHDALAHFHAMGVHDLRGRGGQVTLWGRVAELDWVRPGFEYAADLI